MVNTATTAAAAAAEAMATRVRSDADRMRRKTSTRSRLVSQHVPDPANRVNHPRQAIAFELAP